MDKNFREKFDKSMVEVFNAFGLKQDFKSGTYYFEKIPRDKVEEVNVMIAEKVKECDVVCQVVTSGDCITVRDITWIRD